jgi:hypothetical protein
LFPLVLAALGVGVIVATVWLQRNSQRLTARFGALASDGRPTFPGGVALLLAPLLAVAVQLPAAAALDRAERAEAQASMRQFRAREDRRSREERADSLRREETSAPRRP